MNLKLLFVQGALLATEYMPPENKVFIFPCKDSHSSRSTLNYCFRFDSVMIWMFQFLMKEYLVYQT